MVRYETLEQGYIDLSASRATAYLSFSENPTVADVVEVAKKEFPGVALENIILVPYKADPMVPETIIMRIKK